MKGENPRQIAIGVLQQRGGSTEYIEKLLENELARRTLSPPDRGLCQELVYGIVRWQGTLDWLIARKTGGRPQHAIIRLLLQLGLYQLFWLQRIPNHAAVHETVELAKKLGFTGKAGFLNAVLRGYVREQDATAQDLAHLKQTNPAVGFSHPNWLVERWRERWGAAKTTQLLEWDNRPPLLYARVNLLRAGTAELSAAWEREGIKFEERHWDWTGHDKVFELQSHPPLQRWESFQHGDFYVQDPSTLLAVEILDPQPGETILDLCAAPGGKTACIAQRMRNQGKIAARDAQPDRLQFVRENCARLGLTCVVLDEPKPEEKFDRVLVDAPCSNTGVLRRRVDLRWRVKLGEIERLRETQIALLEQAAMKLKPGGILVYSTCSLEPEENDTVTQAFSAGPAKLKLESQRQLLPFEAGVDGAYVARWRKSD